VKRSRSGTASPDNGPGTTTTVLIVALAIVLAFAGSFIFGLKRESDPEQPVPTATDEAPQRSGNSHARVEVLNGAGKSGLARVATQQLRDAGFDVVQFGNAGEIRATSQVLDRVGKLAIANEIAKTLGVTDVKTVLDSTRYVDATIILGSDWISRTRKK
jgi:hypothetical protein